MKQRKKQDGSKKCQLTPTSHDRGRGYLLNILGYYTFWPLQKRLFFASLLFILTSKWPPSPSIASTQMIPLGRGRRTDGPRTRASTPGSPPTSKGRLKASSGKDGRKEGCIIRPDRDRLCSFGLLRPASDERSEFTRFRGRQKGLKVVRVARNVRAWPVEETQSICPAQQRGGRDRYAFRSSVWCTSVWGLISARHVAKTNDANGSVANALGREDAMRSGLRP